MSSPPKISESTQVTRLRKMRDPTNYFEMDLKSKYMTTAVIYYCNISLGMSLTFLGSALLDFKTKFGVDTQAISFVFTTSMICALVSTIGWGIIFNYVNRHALIAMLMTLTSVLIGVLPYSPSLTTFFILHGIISICSSSYLVAQIVWIIEIWKGKSRFIQGQHFAYSVGCLFPPLIFAPFLQSADDSDPYRVTVNENGTEIMSTIIDVTNLTRTRVAIPCVIIGLISLIGSILLFILLCCLPQKSCKKIGSKNNQGTQNGGVKETVLAESNDVENESKTGVVQNGDQLDSTPPPMARKYLRILLILLAAMFLGSFSSQEVTLTGFIPTFAHSTSLQMSAADGARLLFGYNLAYTSGRLGGILLTSVKGGVRPQFILCGNLILAFVGNFVLLIWGKDLTHFMWLGCVLLGLAMSTGVPSVFAFVQNHLEISNVVGSILMVTGGLLSVAYPLIVGSFIDKVPVILMYTNFFSVALGSFAFLMIVMLTRKFGGKL